MKFFRNIKVRMTAWYLLVLVGLLGLSSVIAYFLLSESLSPSTPYPWDVRTALLQKTTGGEFAVGPFSDVFAGEEEARLRGVISTATYQSSDLLQMASENTSITLDTWTSDGQARIDPRLLVDPAASQDREVWLYLFPVPNSHGTYKLIEVSQSAENRQGTLAAFSRAVLTTAIVTLLLAGALGFLLAWLMLRPLQAITEAVRGMGAKDLSHRLDVGRKDELGELASTLNRMFDHVETAFDAERQVASDLSHEIRTPLAVMQAEATQALRKRRGDEAYQKALETVSREVSHVSSVAERLLFLARSEKGGELVLGQVNLKDLLTEVGWDAKVLCEDKGIAFQSDLSDISDSYVVRGDKIRLRELFLNLVNNAVRYTPCGGAISLTLERQNGYVRAALSDTGIGISEKHLPHIFERFYRVDGEADNKGGVGLGLAICQRIAQLHGGSIEVKSKGGGEHIHSVPPTHNS